MAIGTALRALAVAGHLRRVRCRAEGYGQCRWVTLTYWSRTAHDNEWWTAKLAGEAAAAPERAPAAEQAVVPQQLTAERPAVSAPAEPHGEPSAGIPTAVAAPSPAYLALAELGRRETRLALSAADCATLEPLAAAWFARGVSADYLPRRSPPDCPSASDHPSAWYAAASPTRCRPSCPQHPHRSRDRPALPCALSWSSAPNAVAPARPKRSRTASAAPARPRTSRRSRQRPRSRPRSNGMSPPSSAASAT